MSVIRDDTVFVYVFLAACSALIFVIWIWSFHGNGGAWLTVRGCHGGIIIASGEIEFMLRKDLTPRTPEEISPGYWWDDDIRDLCEIPFSAAGRRVGGFAIWWRNGDPKCLDFVTPLWFLLLPIAPLMWLRRLRGGAKRRGFLVEEIERMKTPDDDG